MADFTPHPAGAPDAFVPASTSPVPITMEGFDSNPSSQPDPWLAPGATESRGNNVDAYTDDNALGGLSAGDLHASTTAATTFDRTSDTGQGPQVSDAAAGPWDIISDSFCGGFETGDTGAWPATLP